MKSKSRIVLVGKAAAGKDHLRKVLEGRGFSYAVSYTTRPPRINEIDGRDYYFISEIEFMNLIHRGFFQEWVEFNGWRYGTSVEQWNITDDVFIMTPRAIEKIDTADRKSTFIIYIDIPIEVRRNRLQSRNMPGDSLERRIEADEEDFEGFINYDIKITDSNF